MLNLIWLGLLLVGVLVAGITGQFAAINQGALGAAKSAVMDVALPLCGAMTLWLGMVRLAEKAGLDPANRSIHPSDFGSSLL